VQQSLRRLGKKGEVMQNVNVIRLYESGLRGRPVPRIQPGDLADPYGRSPWQRAKTLWSNIVEVVRESRKMQASLLGRTTYRHFD
jgi:hypothetical protein